MFRIDQNHLIVTITPNDAQGHLFLNGEDQGSGAAFRIENVQAQPIELSYKSNRHQRWTHNIDIHSHETTRIFIHLEEKNE